MRNKLYILILAGVVSTQTGCAINSSAKIRDPAYQYNEYLESLQKMPAEEYFLKYWSQSAVTEGRHIISNRAKENAFQREAILFSVNFPSEMKKISSMKQSMQNSSACLLVVGETGESERIVFNIPYLLEDNMWLIKEVFIRYMEGDQPFPTEPNCAPENNLGELM